MEKKQKSKAQKLFHQKYKNIDFFDTFEEKQDQKFIQQYKTIKRPENIKESMSKFDYVRRKIYQLKFDEEFKKDQTKNASPILYKYYLKLVDSQIKDPRKLKGIYQIFRQSTLTNFLHQMIDIANGIQVNRNLDAFFLFQLYSLINEIVAFLPKSSYKEAQIKQINIKVYRKIQQFSEQYIKKDQVGVEYNVNKLLIQMKKYFIACLHQKYANLESILKNWITIYQGLDKILKEQLSINQKKIEQKKNPKKGFTDKVVGFNDILSKDDIQQLQKNIHESFFQSSMIQKTLEIFEGQIKWFIKIKDENKISSFCQIILKFNALLQKSKSKNINWLKFKVTRFISYYIGVIDPKIKVQTIKASNKLIQHLKFQMNRKIILKALGKVQGRIFQCQNLLKTKNKQKSQDLAQIFENQYIQAKKYCIQILSKLYKQQGEINALYENQEVWVCQSKAQLLKQKNEQENKNQEFIFKQTQFSDSEVDFKKLGEFIQKITVEKNSKFDFVLAKFKHIECFIDKFFGQSQNTPFVEDKRNYIIGNLSSTKTFQDNIPFLILAAICIKKFFQDQQNLTKFKVKQEGQTNSQVKLNKLILESLKKFNLKFDPQIQKISQILDYFKNSSFAQGWSSFKKYQNQNINIHKNLQVLSQIEEAYNNIVIEQQFFDYRNCQQLKQMFHTIKNKSQLQTLLSGNKILQEKKSTDKLFQKFKDMIMVLNLIIESRSSLEQQTKIQKNIKSQTFNEQLRNYVEHYHYQFQSEKYQKYIIKLDNHPFYSKCTKEQIKKLSQKFQKVRLAKCFTDQNKIVSVKTIKKQIVIILKVIHSQSNFELQRIVRTAIRKYKRMIEQQTLKEIFPFWYIYFNQNTFEIIKKKNQRSFDLIINPYEAFLMSILLEPKTLQEKYLKYPRFPFIHLSDILYLQKKRDWFQFEGSQFDHFLKQMKILSIEQKDTFVKKAMKILNQCPYLWSSERKIVQIITFKQKYQLQINLQETRRKKNQINQAKITKLLKDKKAKLQEQEKIKEPKQLVQLKNDIKRLEQKLREHNPLDGRAIYKQKKRLRESQESDLDQIDKIPQYQFGNNLNVASQGFYSIQGILERSAFQQQVYNYTGEDRDYIKKSAGLFSRFQWADGKPQIKDMIIQVAQKQQKKTLKKDVKDGYFKITFPSFQTFLRFIRNICAHYVYYLDNDIKKQRTYEQKIEIIQKNFPKLFIFLYQWKDVIGKPISIAEQKQQQMENTHQKKDRNNKNFNKEIKSTHELNQFEDDIIKWINKTLSSLFKLNYKEENQELVKRLKDIKQLDKYSRADITKYFQYYKLKKQDLCTPCYHLKMAQNRVIQKCQPFGGYYKFWELLNNLGTFDQKQSNKPFNSIFRKHQTIVPNPKDKTQMIKCKCHWEDNDETWFAFFNTMKRRKIQTQQLQMMYNEEESPIQDQDTWREKLYQYLKNDSEQDVKQNENNNAQNQSSFRWARGKKTLNQFKKLKENQQKLKIFLQKLRQTDYLGNMFIFELLGKFPTLLNDIRQTRYKWDETVLKTESLPKLW